MATTSGDRVQATVTALAPLTVLVDGATTPCPAQAATEFTPTVGGRCYAEDRAPRPPLVVDGIRIRDDEQE